MILNKNIVHLKMVNSTNIYAKELNEIDEIEEGTVIWADEQASGKGRGKNIWKSEKEKNLTFSMIAHPVFLPIDYHFYLSKMVSLALVDFLMNYIDNVRIKWPNDIYVNNQKIAGILIENKIAGDRIQNCIMGMGININQQEFPENLPNPVSLMQITGIEYNLKNLLDDVMYCLDMRFRQLKNGNYNELDKDYDSYLYKKDEICKFSKEGSLFKAIIKQVTIDGYLNVYTEGGENLLLDFGEVSFEI